MQSVDTHGAGDSLTAGVAATLADGGTMREAVVLGTAAGALNVTRHGLGTGEEGAIRNLSKLVAVSAYQAEEPTADTAVAGMNWPERRGNNEDAEDGPDHQRRRH